MREATKFPPVARLFHYARLLLELLWSEGAAAVGDRLWERWRERRRQRRFPLRSEGSIPGPRIVESPRPALLYLSTPPAPRLGGVQAQLLSRLREFEERGQPYALLYPCHPHSQRYRLEVSSGTRWSCELEGPRLRSPGALTQPDFRDTLRRAVEVSRAGVIHLEHLGPAPSTSGVELHAQGFPLVVSVHDFGLFCSRPHLLERPHGRFCHYSQDATRCTQCLQQDWIVEADYQQRRRQAAQSLLRAADAVVFPSMFLRNRFRSLFEDLDTQRQHVLEPFSLGSAAEPRPLLRGSRRRKLLRVAFVGRVEHYKGSRIFERIVESLEEFPRFRWHVLGSGDRNTLLRLRHRGVRIRGYYRQGSLPKLLQHLDIDLVLLLSIVPESFGLTLSEAQRAGAPVLAFDHGALGQRLRQEGGGWLIPPPREEDEVATVGRVVAFLRQLAIDPAALHRRLLLPKAAPTEVSAGEGNEVVSAWIQLYRSLALNH